MALEIVSLNISAVKGTVKTRQESIVLDANGVVGDAHSGPWHRQVSLLGTESYEGFAGEAGRPLQYGEFAENITTSGMLLPHLRPFDRLCHPEVELEITQIGKKCHGGNCAVFQEVGNCVMPKEGVFARVVKGGELLVADQMVLKPKEFRVLVLVMSDRASQGLYTDESGPLLVRLVQEYFTMERYPLAVEHVLLPDDRTLLLQRLKAAVEAGYDALFITGGTGIGPRDITPEAVRQVIDKEIPGIMELIRVKYGKDKPGALLSRSVAGVARQTLVYALPGSPGAVKEYMDEILKSFMHACFMVLGINRH